jgi:anti-sigma B factor antagonist
MAGVDLSTSESDGQLVVTLRGQLDIAEAAGVAAALAAVAAREPQIIVDLAALQFIDSSGVAALVRGRNLARRAGGELLLAAPQQQVLLVLTLTRLIDVFPLHATVDEAAGSFRRVAAVPVLPMRHRLASWPRAAMRSAARAVAAERRPPGKQAEAAEILPRCGLSSVYSSPGRGWVSSRAATVSDCSWCRLTGGGEPAEPF